MRLSRRIYQMAELRQRATAMKTEADPVPDEPKAVVEESKAWHTALSVRVILVLLMLFFLMHLFLWKVVYDFAMDTNHERLRGSVKQAVDSLYTLYVTQGPYTRCPEYAIHAL